MKIAVLENNTVVDIIICENVELAEELTGKQCVQFTDDEPIILEVGNVVIPPADLLP